MQVLTNKIEIEPTSGKSNAAVCSLRHPDAEGILHSYEYLKNNRLSKISFDGQAIDLIHDKTRTSKIRYPNGTSSDYGYNENDWLGRIDTQNGTTTIQARDYQF